MGENIDALLCSVRIIDKMLNHISPMIERKKKIKITLNKIQKNILKFDNFQDTDI